MYFIVIYFNLSLSCLLQLIRFPSFMQSTWVEIWSWSQLDIIVPSIQFHYCLLFCLLFIFNSCDNLEHISMNYAAAYKSSLLAERAEWVMRECLSPFMDGCVLSNNIVRSMNMHECSQFMTVFTLYTVSPPQLSSASTFERAENTNYLTKQNNMENWFVSWNNKNPMPSRWMK